MFSNSLSADEARGQLCVSKLVFSCLGVAAIFFSLPSALQAAARISAMTGTVRIRPANTQLWNEIAVHYILSPGDEVKTGRSSSATIMFDDGSRVEIGPKSAFMLEDAKAKAAMSFSFGSLKAWVNKSLASRFSVRTTTAVCSVRGTHFGVDVGAQGATSVALFEGSLGVADNKGNEMLLQEGQRIDVTMAGLGAVVGINEAGEAEKQKERAALKREVGLEMTKDEVQALAAEEMKNAVYQQGKAMIDVNGNRVRIEEYIIRPADNQFKLVVLNERVDRFDFFYYKGTFNTTLPPDLSSALRQIPGCVGTACTYFLRSFETGRSNTIDNVLEVASGGHLVDVNNNQVAGDEVKFAFNPNVNDFVVVGAATADTAIANPGSNANTPFFKALFDTYKLSFNGVSHHSWSPDAGITASTVLNCPTGICGANIGVKSYGTTAANDQRTLVDVTNLIEPPNCSTLDNCTGTRTPGKFHDNVYLQNGDGTIWEKFENYIITDEGDIVDHAQFAGATKGADFKRELLKINFQQIVTASEFGGRKIDLVVEPKLFIQSGLIP